MMHYEITKDSVSATNGISEKILFLLHINYKILRRKTTIQLKFEDYIRRDIIQITFQTETVMTISNRIPCNSLKLRNWCIEYIALLFTCSNRNQSLPMQSQPVATF